MSRRLFNVTIISDFNTPNSHETEDGKYRFTFMANEGYTVSEVLNAIGVGNPNKYDIFWNECRSDLTEELKDGDVVKIVKHNYGSAAGIARRVIGFFRRIAMAE